MRRAMIVTAAVLVCALAACALSQAALNRAVSRATALHARVLEAAESDQPGRARALLGELAAFWEDRVPTLEKLVSHDALHDVTAALAEARICLACDDRDDFLRTMSTAKLGLEHLHDEEALSWQNLY